MSPTTQIEDMSIYGSDGSTIGEVEEVLGTQDGKATAVSTEVGGFLGIDDRDVVLSLDQLQLKDGKLVTMLSKEQIEALKTWDDN